MNMDKGKQKIYQEYFFNANGVMSQEAISVMDEGNLGSIAPSLIGKAADLDAPVGHGLYGQDVFHHALSGTLKEFLAQKQLTAELLSKHFIL
ncbi:hypothetical protein DCAR_0414524 [Daucus carota subsp. sativus]|uniref:Uncharacterized protein n=1 Tax=Daucus carota subsp. sativus TaxID=79200 RepID=A0AAF1ATX2_DAUCS|nr:hypothetical protein DCAR_0414524 [Daucus carota subsp. sativus]